VGWKCQTGHVGQPQILTELFVVNLDKYDQRQPKDESRMMKHFLLKIVSCCLYPRMAQRTHSCDPESTSNKGPYSIWEDDNVSGCDHIHTGLKDSSDSPSNVPLQECLFSDTTVPDIDPVKSDILFDF